MEAMFDFIFKISCRIPQVREWFKQKKSTWAWLIEWAENSRFPVSLIDSNTNMRLLKKRGNLNMP